MLNTKYHNGLNNIVDICPLWYEDLFLLQDMDTCQYTCPQEMAALFARWYPDKKDVYILNFAAGTGLQGVEVKCSGLLNC